ncbi:MAG: hypothetical protein AB7F28_00415 [Candidatus Margulisiibacteriota bacterium]
MPNPWVLPATLCHQFYLAGKTLDKAVLKEIADFAQDHQGQAVSVSVHFEQPDAPLAFTSIGPIVTDSAHPQALAYWIQVLHWGFRVSEAKRAELEPTVSAFQHHLESRGIRLPTTLADHLIFWVVTALGLWNTDAMFNYRKQHRIPKDSGLSITLSATPWHFQKQP